jgi:hypothetical protein
MKLDASQTRVVDRATVDFLRRNPSFARMSQAQQAETIRAMSAIVRTMAENGAASGGDPYAPHAVGLASDDGKLTAKQVFDKSGAGEIGSVIGAGVTQASRMVKEINFPQFVASLIDGTFKAIVTSSIEQMKAYAEMVQSVSASLNEFKDKNVSQDEAQNSLVQRYPKLLQVTVVNGERRVAARDDAGFDEELPDFAKDFGLSEQISSLDDETINNTLVPAAHEDLARGRQQLLATTILMGINRIIVTDGRINARIRFKFDAVETRKSKVSAQDVQQFGDTVVDQKAITESGASSGSWWGKSTGEDYSYEDNSQTVTTPNIQVTSDVETTADGNIKAGGEMFGEVAINFRSETFPLEKMVNTDQMMRLQQAQSGFRGTPGPATAARPAATPGTAAPPAPAPAVGPPAGP